MPWTIGTIDARTSATGNPTTFSKTVLQGENLLIVMLKVNGGTNRAGGSLTYGSQTMSQANSTQKAAASPEASTELWYLINPTVGTATLTIPNTGGLTIFRVVASGRCSGTPYLVGANGSNGTSTNPSAGSVTLPDYGNILFATVCSGATTWAPSARSGTQIQDTDDGAHGGGTQYLISTNPVPAGQTMSWTFGTSDDWGAVVAAFGELFSNAVGTHQNWQVGDGGSVSDPLMH